jgi:membrane protease YdiL (CAAX protease family)
VSDPPEIAGPEPEEPIDRTVAQGAALPRPLGIIRTFGWTILALLAGGLSGATLVIVVAKGPWEPPNDIDAMPFVWVAAMTALAAFFAVIVWACRQHGWRAIDYFGLAPPRGAYLRSSSAAFLFGLAVSLVASAFGPLIDDPDSPLDLLPPVLWIVEVVVIAPVAEELVFRGFLYRELAATRLGISGAILVTALLWSGLHFDRTSLGFIDVFFSGLALGWLRWRNNSVVTTMAVHGLTNTIATIEHFFW